MDGLMLFYEIYVSNKFKFGFLIKEIYYLTIIIPVRKHGNAWHLILTKNNVCNCILMFIMHEVSISEQFSFYFQYNIYTHYK